MTNILHIDEILKYTGVESSNREALLQCLDEFVTGEPDFYLCITLPCGNERNYRIREDVPMHSIRCNCGEITQEHWFIRYTEET